MKNGMGAQATAKEKHLLSRTRHGREWYQVVWEFEAGARRHTFTQRPYYTDPVHVGEQRTVLYDRRSPDKATLLDQCALLIGRADPDTTTLTSSWRFVRIPLGTLSAALIAAYAEILC